jgi:hypothetical protein
MSVLCYPRVLICDILTLGAKLLGKPLSGTLGSGKEEYGGYYTIKYSTQQLETLLLLTAYLLELIMWHH